MYRNRLSRRAFGKVRGNRRRQRSARRLGRFSRIWRRR